MKHIALLVLLILLSGVLLLFFRSGPKQPLSENPPSSEIPASPDVPLIPENQPLLQRPLPSTDHTITADRLPASQPPTSTTLVFVIGPDGNPTQQASVSVRFTSGKEESGATDATGVWSSYVSTAELPIVYLAVDPQNPDIARFRASADEIAQLSTTTGTYTVKVQLSAGGRVHVLVLDEKDFTVPVHPVQLYHIGNDRAVGVCTTNQLFTDDRGRIEFVSIQPGRWDAFSDQWRDKDASGHNELDVLNGRINEVVVRVSSLPKDTYASGRFPDLASQPSDGFHRLRDFTLERLDKHAKDFIYEDGAFYVIGPFDHTSVRVIDNLRKRSSAWIPISAGQHSQDFGLVWDGPPEQN